MLVSLILSALAFASTQIAAEYEVPVPAELSAYSRFAMEPVKIKNENGQVRVRYKLPVLLTGVETKIEMRGSYGRDGVLLLNGGQGSAECDGFQSGQQCRVKYKGLAVSLEAAQAELDKLGLSEAHRAAVLQVIKRFQGVDDASFAPSFLLEREGGDMQGIIHYGEPVRSMHE
jgi:hypothetical protein